MRILFNIIFSAILIIGIGRILGAFPQPVEAQKEMACLGRLSNYYRCVVRCHPILYTQSSGSIRNDVLSVDESIPY